MRAYEFRQYLDEFVYDKIWSELSARDKKILDAISRVESGKIEEIRALMGIETNEFNPYRKRLINHRQNHPPNYAINEYS